MKLRHFHILLILLAGLILCPLLGGYCGPEGLENIDQHLTNEHGVNTGDYQREPAYNGGSSNGNSHDHNALQERLNTLEKQLSERRDNGELTSEQREKLDNDIQNAKQTAIDNVGGDIRTIGNLAVNKIPEHEHLEESKCPPCPPCDRCPEPSFTCKKVPNYQSKNQDMFPRAVLSDFSNFGM
tara:strand:+ start:52 stop:600 length:549 start_codon:yes stop_codon:yes gene_type:complete